VSQQRTSEVEFSVHFEAETPFDMARHDLPEQHLFREILRPDYHARLGRTSGDRKSTRLNSSHANISYAVFCLKKKKNKHNTRSSSHRSRQRACRCTLLAWY